jgi:hypothetical protein
MAPEEPAAREPGGLPPVFWVMVALALLVSIAVVVVITLIPVGPRLR